ncbi:MAG: carboxypeptidase-like regulatory domain-containing protein [Chloroflexota bacterium]
MFKKTGLLRLFVVLGMALALLLSTTTPAYADIHLTVVVVDCDTAQPISGAKVTVTTAKGRPSGTTNERGQITFAKIQPGDVTHTVAVSHPKYLPASQSAYMKAWSSQGMRICLRKPAPPPTPVPPTATITPLPPTPTFTPVVPTATFTPAAPKARLYSISGQALDRDKRGIAGVLVRDQQGHQAQTDANGSYRISDLLPGHYLLTPVDPNHQLWPVSRLASIQDADLSGQDFNELRCGTNRAPLVLQGAPSIRPGLPNPPWASEKIDSSTRETIGDLGCNLAAQVMLINFFGMQANPPFQTDPSALNAWLKANNGYAGNFLYPSRIPVFVKDSTQAAALNLVRMQTCSTPQTVSEDSELTRHLCAGGLAVIGVNNGGHWVVAHGLLNSQGGLTYAISDPWQGQTTLAQQYNNTYCGATYYQGSSFNLEKATPGGPYLAGDLSSIEIVLASPAHMIVTDPKGRKTGFDPRIGKAWDEIPRAGYVTSAILGAETKEAHKVKSLVIPQPQGGLYTLEVIGYGEGQYSAKVLQTSSSGNESEQEFSGNATEGSVDTYTFTYNPEQPATGSPAAPPSSPLWVILAALALVASSVVLAGASVMVILAYLRRS